MNFGNFEILTKNVQHFQKTNRNVKNVSVKSCVDPIKQISKQHSKMITQHYSINIKSSKNFASKFYNPVLARQKNDITDDDRILITL